MPEEKPNEDLQYKLSLWLVSHKVLLRKIGRFTLMGLAALPWLFFIIYLVIYFTNISKTNRILEELALTQIITTEISKPQPIDLLTTKAFESDTGVYDLLAEIANTNANFAVEFTYQFILSSQMMDAQKGYLLPGETRYFSNTNLNLGTAHLTQADLNISEVKWKRITHPEKLPQANFLFEEVEYSLVDLAGGGDNVQSEVAGKVYNQSAYGFNKVEVLAVLLFGGQPIAVKNTTINQFFSGEEKPLKFTWPKKYPYQTEVVAQATTNVLDSENLILP